MSKNVLETHLENTVSKLPFDTYIPAVIAGELAEIKSLEELGERPLRVRERRSFDDLRGFVAYVNDYKTDATRCFAGKSELRAHFDYHDKDAPAWDAHQAYYQIQPSQRWREWEGAHNRWMSQRDFADFLDSGLNEIVEPAQADVLTLVKNFRATINHDVQLEETPGGSNLQYTRKLKSGSTKQENIDIPEHVIIEIQPYDNLSVINPMIEDKEKRIPAYKLRAKINWRLDTNHNGDNSLEFKVQILNFQRAKEETQECFRNAISELTNVKTYIG